MPRPRRHVCCLVWFYADGEYRRGCPHCSKLSFSIPAVDGDELRAEQSQEAHTRLCRTGGRRW